MEPTIKKQDPDERQAFARRLNLALDELGVPSGWGRQTEAGKLFGITPRGAAKWLKGESMPELYRFPSVAHEARVRVEWLLAGEGDMHDAALQAAQPPVAVIGTIEDGPTGNAEPLGFLSIPSNDPDAYALRAATDALSPRIRIGEVVLIEPKRKAESGEDVAVRLSGGAFLVRELIAIRSSKEVLLHLVTDPWVREIQHLDNIDTMHAITGVCRASSFQPK